MYQRVEQLRDYIVVAPDWINYAILDEITDHFAPHIQQLGAEVDDIDDPATLLAVKDDETEIVLRISACRKRVMQLIRLLGTKADVVRVLIKRSEGASSSCSSSPPCCDKSNSADFVPTHRRGGPSSSSLVGFFKEKAQQHWHQQQSPQQQQHSPHAYPGRGRSSFQVIEKSEDTYSSRIYPDTALYLGDVQGKFYFVYNDEYHFD